MEDASSVSSTSSEMDCGFLKCEVDCVESVSSVCSLRGSSFVASFPVIVLEKCNQFDKV